MHVSNDTCHLYLQVGTSPLLKWMDLLNAYTFMKWFLAPQITAYRLLNAKTTSENDIDVAGSVDLDFNSTHFLKLLLPIVKDKNMINANPRVFCAGPTLVDRFSDSL